MNKNKVIFAIIGAIILVLLLLLVRSLNSDDTQNNNTPSSWDLSIWIMHDDGWDFANIVSGFKEMYPAYASKNILVESFDDRVSYTNALTSAIILGQAPDIFVQNNGEISAFENQILGIDPNIISPNNFRLDFKPVFWDDLVISSEDDWTVEFLKGVPAGYEALWIYYNRKYFLRPSEIENWSDFLQEVQSISEKYSNIIPVALWNGSWVSRSVDIISSLLTLEWETSLTNADTNQIKQVLWMYKWFWDRDGDNRYNILSAPFEKNTDVDYFAQWDVAAMIWYPRDLLQIDRIWYQSSFLFASPFPEYIWAEKKTSINYNYFVVNKDTDAVAMAQDFLAYLSSQEWQQAYIDTFPYYLSPNATVFAQMPEKKILPEYNIVYKNFISERDELISFDVGNKNLYTDMLVPILDLDSWYDSEFVDMKSFITCSTTKQNTLLNLSSPCK